MRSQHFDNELFQDRFGRELALRLNDTAEDIPYDIAERLRAARLQAMAKHKAVKTQLVAAIAGRSGTSATLTMGGDDPQSRWTRVAAWLPLLALVAGLLSIAMIQDDFFANEVAEVDSALLTDDLPPAAYTDPGFAQFLRSPKGD